MPELVDVEGFRRQLARTARGQRVERVEAPAPELLRNTSPQGIGRALHGERFRAPKRHGKWLLAPVGPRVVLFHFGMTGDLHWTASGDAPDGHARVIFHTDGGELRYLSQRKFGGVWLARGPDEVDSITGPLGPDATELDRETFRERLGARHGGVKAALMDQEVLAGIGNELSDEILWRARIAPRATASDLGAKRLGRLYDAMRDVLRRAMPHGRIPRERGWLERVRTDDAPRCPRCRKALRRETVASRTALWCPRCQRD